MLNKKIINSIYNVGNIDIVIYSSDLTWRLDNEIGANIWNNKYRI